MSINQQLLGSTPRAQKELSILRVYLFSNSEIVRILRQCTTEPSSQAKLLQLMLTIESSPAQFIFKILKHYAPEYRPFTESEQVKCDYDYVYGVFSALDAAGKTIDDGEMDIRVVKHFNNLENLCISEQLSEISSDNDLITVISHAYYQDVGTKNDFDLEEEKRFIEHYQEVMYVTSELVKQLENVFLQKQTPGAYSYVIFALKSDSLVVAVH